MKSITQLSFAQSVHSPTLIREIDSRDRSIAFSIIGFLFACYLFTYTGIIQSSDGLSMFATAESIVRGGEIDSNQLIWMGNQQGNFGPDGDLYSRKGLGMTLLAVPLVWLARMLPGLGLVQMALLLNPLLTAWTGGLLFRAGRRLGWSRAAAAAAALLFGLATLAWPYTQTFFSDPVSTLGLFGAFYGLLGYSQTARKRYLVMGSLAWSLAYLARVVNLLTLPIFGIGLIVAIFAAAPVERPDRLPVQRPTSLQAGLRSLFMDHWRPLAAFVLPVVLSGAASLWWNWARYGSIWESGYVETEQFSAVWWFGIIGLLAGPARGLIWYSPALLLGLGGLRWFWREARYVLLFCLSIFALYVLVYGKWYMWHGGYSWGPRFLVPALPFLALLSGPAWEAWMVQGRSAVVRAGVIALLAISIAVQWLGMLIPFHLVQDWLAATVTPLFAPETFVQLRYSPLAAQWRFLSPETIHLAWWRAGGGWMEIEWVGLLLPLAAVAVGVLMLQRHLRATAPNTQQERVPHLWLYPVALVFITLVVLVFYQTNLSDAELMRAAHRIQNKEAEGDAIVLLRPELTQNFADVYHGKLPTYGFMPRGELGADEAAWLERVRSTYQRVWLLPDASLPEQSGWERPLRIQDFLLLDTRVLSSDGQRLSLYAMSKAQSLQETGIGTIFGDPALVEEGINAGSGWFRLDGYALTPETEPGDAVLLALRWESLRAVDYDYHVFVHLLNTEGERVAQRDGQPVQWLYPTSTWQPGEEIVDRYGLLLPDDFAQGRYTIAVGLYDPVNGQRLPVSAGPRDYAIELGPVEVESVR